MGFKKWLSLREMAYLTLPPSVNLQIPCETKKRCSIAGLDMRFEDPPQVRDSFGHVLNQGSKFVARIPGEAFYIVYRGFDGVDSKTYSEKEIESLGEEFTRIPDDWLTRARPIDHEGKWIN